MTRQLVVKQLGRTDYEAIWHAMQAFTESRDEHTPDEIWITEHDAVYTLGLNRKLVRMPSDTSIPVVLADRGGKITYHGPGQLIIYLLIDLKRKSLSIRQLVSAMESSIVELLAEYDVKAYAKADAPGVYVLINQVESKIASLGLRLKNQCSYHGLSLNIDMDLSPFSAIDPCGYSGLQVTQTSDLGLFIDLSQASEYLLKALTESLSYTSVKYETHDD
ncbi:lipoyl(octanoyl) transferase LipB [Methyloradius palustris]|uniref:Octanoyltransferase n=1 Tax=Methyloradius palustris TaxID=2778876 RepID=A0A8D5JZY2_9PROT|nr:lipoyl(octanoyl) transferase LipB [Methyloradius palustris]BCM26112.1 octanoyltransferase [Methyloradius palustris]